MSNEQKLRKVEAKSQKLPMRSILMNVTILLFSVVLLLLGSVFIIGYNALNSIEHEDDNIEEVEDDEDDYLLSNSSVLNIAIFGSDSRGQDRGRSDTSLILSVNKDEEMIKITSLLRDIWVSIPGYGSDRLNAAYSYGGAKLAVKTIQKNFGIKIDRYIILDFDSFRTIIDKLGGIDVNLTEDEVKFINLFSPNEPQIEKAGLVHLNGDQALSYARDRKSSGSDFDRTKRQRIVMKTIFDKLKDANVMKIINVITDVCPAIKTNFSNNEITKLARNVMIFLKYDIGEYRVPEDGNFSNENIDGKSVLVINNKKKALDNLSKFIYG